MNELALFSGIGGGLLASRLLGWTTVAAVEIEPYCREAIFQRQRDGLLDEFPIWDDIRTFDPAPWRGLVSIVTGGFPCQDVSVAGKGLGVGAGERSGLWREFARVIGGCRPEFAFIENSPELVARGLDLVLGDLAEMGYDARWGVLGAWHLGGAHRRDRMFILAHAAGDGRGPGRSGRSASSDPRQRKPAFQKSALLADADGDRRSFRPAAGTVHQAVQKGSDQRPAGRGNERRQPVPAEPPGHGPSVSVAGLAKGLRQASERVWDESRLDRVTHGVPDILDGVVDYAKQMGRTKACAKAYFSAWEALHSVWNDQKIAKTPSGSSETVGRSNCVLSLPRGTRSIDWGEMGNREEIGRQEMQDLQSLVQAGEIQECIVWRLVLFSEAWKAISREKMGWKKQGKKLRLVRKGICLYEGLSKHVRQELWEQVVLAKKTSSKQRIGRLKGIGNAQVPQVAAAAFLILSQGWLPES